MNRQNVLNCEESCQDETAPRRQEVLFKYSASRKHVISLTVTYHKPMVVQPTNFSEYLIQLGFEVLTVVVMKLHLLEYKTKTKLNGFYSASEPYPPSGSRLSAKLVPTFVGREMSRGQHGRSLRLLILMSIPKPLIVAQVAPQMFS
jgi:hypothetical protein